MAWELIAELPPGSTSFVHEGVGAGEHCYKVTGVNEAGDSEDSNIACAAIAGEQIVYLGAGTKLGVSNSGMLGIRTLE